MKSSCQRRRIRLSNPPCGSSFRLVATLAACFFFPMLLRSQDSAAAQDRAQAQSLYATHCAVCHGAQAHGGEYGPALAGNRDLQGKSLTWIHDILHHGIPAGGMPAFDLPDPELDDLASLVMSFNQPEVKKAVPGDPAKGEQYFFAAGQCSSCHMVNGRGSATGPDLSSIATELTAGQIREALVEPSARFAPGYTPVTVRLKNGQLLHGFARGQSSFETVLQDLQGRFHLLSHQEIQSFQEDSQSPMPAVAANAEQLQDLLAYLSVLTGVRPDAGVPNTTSADATPISGGIPFARVLHPLPGDWLSYNGGLAGNRYSSLAGVNTGNTAHLQLQWIYTVPLWRQFFPNSSYYRENLQYYGLETTPLVADGIMYATGPQQAFALDARTGEPIWNYSRQRTPGIVGDASLASNRGLAMLGDKLFMVTDDAHLIALNRTTGRPVWETVMPDKPMHYGGTVAPLVVKDMVIAGVAGGDWGIRGFLSAYRASDGKLLWRRWTVPAKGEPGAETWGGDPPENGGGGTWTTGSYDPETDTIYWATGNPYPDGDDRHRPGDNLYTNSILALNPTDGALKWYYQVTPHDVEDWDTTGPLLLTDTFFQGKKRQLLLHADKNGFFYVLDRSNGHVLLAKPFVTVTWASGIGKDGRPQRLPNNGVVCPAAGSNWNATAFNPETGLYYLVGVEKCNVSLTASGAAREQAEKEPAKKYLEAVDLEGKVRWKNPMAGPGGGKRGGGVLATAGGLLFYGEPSGDIVAADARSGRALWHFRTSGESKASPITYLVGGKQFVALAVGPNILSFSLP
jgi:PQQ-dependent dehydrogenase (methanol/ethanol family)